MAVAALAGIAAHPAGDGRTHVGKQLSHLGVGQPQCGLVGMTGLETDVLREIEMTASATDGVPLAGTLTLPVGPGPRKDRNRTGQAYAGLTATGYRLVPRQAAGRIVAMCETMTDMRPTAEELRQLWQMTKLPQEDVLFTPTYESAGRGADGKPLCNAMVAMFTDEPGSFSDMHRLPTDEIWHFYLGDPIELLLLHPDGRDELVILGTDVLGGQRVQVTVPSATWMGARLRPGGEYGVYGNTMAPGFVPSDFDPGDPAELTRRWPHRAELIAALTRSLLQG